MNRTLAPLVLAALVLTAITAFAGCAGDSEDKAVAKKPQEKGTLLKISDTSTPGEWDFDTHRLTARPGRSRSSFTTTAAWATTCASIPGSAASSPATRTSEAPR